MAKEPRKIKCGNCRKYHGSVDEVASCYGVERQPPKTNQKRKPNINRNKKKSKRKWGPDDKPLTPSEYPQESEPYNYENDADPQPWDNDRVGERLETAERLEGGYF